MFSAFHVDQEELETGIEEVTIAIQPVPEIIGDPGWRALPGRAAVLFGLPGEL